MKLLLQFLCFISGLTFVGQASQGEAHQSGQSLANSVVGKVTAAAQSTNPAGVVPGFETDRPQESSLEAGSIGEAALQASTTNEAAQHLTSEARDRKSFKIDPNTDPLFVGANQVIANPQKAMDEEFIEVSGSDEEASEELKTCEESGDEYLQRCSKYLKLKLKITPEVRTAIYSCPGHWGYVDHREGPSSVMAQYFCNGCVVTGEHVTPKKVEVVEKEWVDGCAVLEGLTEKGLCRYHSRTTSPKNETRTIDGEPVQQDHFEEHYEYACLKASNKSCAGLREKGCYQINSVCKEKMGDVCVLWEQSYRCPTGKRSTKMFRSTNKSNPYCLTGNCVDTSYEANGEMMTVMSQLAALKEVQDDLRNYKVIFKGNPRACTRHCVNFKDCCGSEKGWGVSVHLAECDKDEKELRQLRNKNLCIQVGTYCAEKVLGVCIRKKTSFCCYGTKMARLIQQNGRSQLGLGFGAPKSPDCSGFSAEELSRIDFSGIDFSEIFEDIRSKVIPKGQGEILAQVSTKRLQENMTLLTKPSLSPNVSQSTQGTQNPVPWEEGSLLKPSVKGLKEEPVQSSKLEPSVISSVVSNSGTGGTTQPVISSIPRSGMDDDFDISPEEEARILKQLAMRKSETQKATLQQNAWSRHMKNRTPVKTGVFGGKSTYSAYDDDFGSIPISPIVKPRTRPNTVQNPLIGNEEHVSKTPPESIPKSENQLTQELKEKGF